MSTFDTVITVFLVAYIVVLCFWVSSWFVGDDRAKSFVMYCAAMLGFAAVLFLFYCALCGVAMLGCSILGVDDVLVVFSVGVSLVLSGMLTYFIIQRNRR